MASSRKFKESPMPQAPGEKVAYLLTTTPWGSSPTSPVVTIKQNGLDVTADVTSGSASVASDVITTPLIQDLTAGKVYRIDVLFVTAGNTFKAHGLIKCDDEED